MKKNIAIIVFAFLSVTIFAQTPPKKHPMTHGLWHQVVKKYVSDKGEVYYPGIKDELNFKKYMTIMKFNPPTDSWTEIEKLTYWINLYNAATVELIIKNYPLKSIKDIKTTEKSPWDIKFINMKDGNNYSLNDIEHNIIRKQFDEPRIHFALVCAAKSCPNLRNEAYFEESLDSQLNDQAKKFLKDPKKNQITPSEIKISEVFSWFEGDFIKKSKTIQAYLSQFLDKPILKTAKVSYLPYDWSLNEWKYGQ